jgi:hypothetical protein
LQHPRRAQHTGFCSQSEAVIAVSQWRPSQAMINMTKNKNFEVPPAGIFTGLPFESLRSQRRQ